MTGDVELLMDAARAKGWRCEADYGDLGVGNVPTVKVLNSAASVTFGDWKRATDMELGDVYKWRAPPYSKESDSLYLAVSKWPSNSDVEARVATLTTVGNDALNEHLHGSGEDRTHGDSSAINDDVTEHGTESEAFGSLVEDLFRIMTDGASLIAGLSDDVKPYLSFSGAGIDFTRDSDNTLYRLTLAVADEEAEVVQIGEGDAREGIAGIKEALALLPASAGPIPKLESLGEALADGVEGNPVADDAPRYVRIPKEDAMVIGRLLTEHDSDRGKPTHKDPLLQRYMQAAQRLEAYVRADSE